MSRAVTLGLAVFAMIVAALYGAALAYLYTQQRNFLYRPSAVESSPQAVSLPMAEAIHLATADGERLLAWRILPAPGRPMLIYFHGNGGGIDLRADRFRAFAAAGFGLLAVEYRGYAGSTGSPTEAGLNLDALAAYDEAIRLGAAPQRIVLVGESLGTGVAVSLATQRPIGALMLDSPYTSLPDVAASVYWMFPVHALMKDVFASKGRIGEVRAPILMAHGTADDVVPFNLGERLFALAPSPKTFLRVEGAGHLALGLRLPEAVAWIETALKRGSRP